MSEFGNEIGIAIIIILILGGLIFLASIIAIKVQKWIDKPSITKKRAKTSSAKIRRTYTK